jgi:transcriptional regulator with XRE-family HTH domain
MNTNKIVGSRIKSLRETKSISLEEMAERSGLSVAQIERVEENKDLPSLAPLIKIARVLGVRLGTFLDDQDTLEPVVSRKKNYKEKDSVSFSTNQTTSHTHMDYYALSSDKAGRHMEPFIISIDPKQEGSDFIASSHEGEEFIYCLGGVLEITYGNETYILEEGDSIYYDSIVAHHVHAADEQGAKILAVVYTPI